MVAVPPVGSSMPVSIFSVVDFPAPLGPRKPTIWPGGNFEGERVHGDLGAETFGQLIQ